MRKTSTTFGTSLGLWILLSSSLAQAAESESEALARARAANQARDFATSVAIYQEWRQRGSAAASTLLGLMYWSGTAVATDHQRACNLFAEAEKRGDPSGTELLADCYYHGDGRPQDYTQSAALLLPRLRTGRGPGGLRARQSVSFRPRRGQGSHQGLFPMQTKRGAWRR